MTDPHTPDQPRPDQPRPDASLAPGGTPGGSVPVEHTQEIPRHDSTREIPVVSGPVASEHQGTQSPTPDPYGAPGASFGPGAAVGAGGGGSVPPPGAPAYGSGSSVGPTPRTQRSGWWKVPVTALAAALLASGGTAAYFGGHLDGSTGAASSSRPSSTSTNLNTQAPLSQGDSTAPDWKATASAVSPSVVSISVQDGSGSGGEGSGVILDTAGHIVTNNHVVGDSGSSPQIIVTLDDQRAFQAKIVGLDPSTDLAVIKLEGDAKDLRPIAVGNSDDLTVGAPVMAVGNPLGLSGTVTTGIVSALNRPVRTDNSQQQDPLGGIFGRQQSGNEVITNAIQTSAPINPGNSGGALVNADGQLIGINSSIASMGSATGGQSGSIGIGFAIPVNEVTSIADQLIKNGKAEHAFLGVSSTTDMIKDGSNQRVAAVISSVVPGSPADKAGLRAKDAIIAIEGEPVTGSTSLVAQVRERTVGDKATMTYLRDGKRADVEVTFAQRSSQ